MGAIQNDTWFIAGPLEASGPRMRNGDFSRFPGGELVAEQETAGTKAQLDVLDEGPRAAADDLFRQLRIESPLTV